MELIDPFWSLVIQALTAVVAVAALSLSILNYRREKRRDEIQIHVALKTNNSGPSGGPYLPEWLEADITNTGQRPTTMEAVALVFARQRIWRWYRSPRYIWSESPRGRSASLAENRPHSVMWRWEAVHASLSRGGLDESLHFVGLRVRVSGERIFDRVPRSRAVVERVARDIVTGRTQVRRR